MSYEYKEKIKHDLTFLDGLMSSGIWKRKEKLKELDEVYTKAQAYDKYLETQQTKLNQVKRRVQLSTNDSFNFSDITEYIAHNDIINELESYRK